MANENNKIDLLKIDDTVSDGIVASKKVALKSEQRLDKVKNESDFPKDDWQVLSLLDPPKELETARDAIKAAIIVVDTVLAILETIKQLLKILALIEALINNALAVILNFILDQIQNIVDQAKSTGVYALTIRPRTLIKQKNDCFDILEKIGTQNLDENQLYLLVGRIEDALATLVNDKQAEYYLRQIREKKEKSKKADGTLNVAVLKEAIKYLQEESSTYSPEWVTLLDEYIVGDPETYEELIERVVLAFRNINDLPESSIAKQANKNLVKTMLDKTNKESPEAVTAFIKAKSGFLTKEKYDEYVASLPNNEKGNLIKESLKIQLDNDDRNTNSILQDFKRLFSNYSFYPSDFDYSASRLSRPGRPNPPLGAEINSYLLLLPIADIAELKRAIFDIWFLFKSFPPENGAFDYWTKDWFKKYKQDPETLNRILGDYSQRPKEAFEGFYGTTVYQLASPVFDEADDLILLLRGLIPKIDSGLFPKLIKLIEQIQRELVSLKTILEKIDRILAIIQKILDLNIYILKINTRNGNDDIVRKLRDAKGFPYQGTGERFSFFGLSLTYIVPNYEDNSLLNLIEHEFDFSKTLSETRKNRLSIMSEDFTSDYTMTKELIESQLEILGEQGNFLRILFK